VQRLVDSLGAGDVGCVRAGTYVGAVKFSRGGSAGARVVLRGWPGERAVVSGRVWVARGADFVTVENLFLDGRNPGNLPSPTINASDVVFRSNDVTNGHTSICFNLGHADYGAADRALIELNRIHDCGVLPAANHHHGVYVARAAGAVIRSNWIYANADRGIQLYPNAQHTEITGNVIDSNGQGIIFGGLGSDSSDNTRVHHNLITNSVLRNNVESHYDAGVPWGQNNSVTANCVSGGARDTGDGRGGIEYPQQGFTATNNNPAKPIYTNRATGDYRLTPQSPCQTTLPTNTTPGPNQTIPTQSRPRRATRISIAARCRTDRRLQKSRRCVAVRRRVALRRAQARPAQLASSSS
jgi:hypothetical protein